MTCPDCERYKISASMWRNEAYKQAGTPLPWDADELIEKAVMAERNKLAAWMMAQGYSTGHGDSIEDLAKELEWQVRESEREACAKVCESLPLEWEDQPNIAQTEKATMMDCALAIRARGVDMK